MSKPNLRIPSSVLGFMPPTILYGGPIGKALNSATQWIGFSFCPEYATSLNEVRVFCKAVAGTIGSSVTCYIYADSGSGTPATTVLASSATMRAGWAANTWVDFIGFSLALTAGSLYWIVLKNGNGTPTTNYPSVAYGPADSIPSLAAGISGGFPTWGSSLYSGSWTANVNGYSCLRLKYSDGNYDGLPLQAAISLQGVNGAATGVKFTMPSNSGISYNVVGVALGFDGAAGTPAGQPLYGLYLGASAIVPTISTIPFGMSGQWFNNGTNAPAWFSAPVAIPGGSIVRLAVTESVVEASKGPRVYGLAFDTDTNSLPLLPFAGSAVFTQLAGGVWTDTPSEMPYFLLILSETNPITISGAPAANPSSFLIG